MWCFGLVFFGPPPSPNHGLWHFRGFHTNSSYWIFGNLWQSQKLGIRLWSTTYWSFTVETEGSAAVSMLPWWIREHFVAGKQEQECSRLVKLYSLLTWRDAVVLYKKTLVLVTVEAHSYKICDSLCTTGKSAGEISENSGAIDCSLHFMGLAPGELWGFCCYLFGGRGCISAVMIEGDKIFARVTSCTQSDVGIYYPLYNQHFIHNSCIEFVVRNCVRSVLMIIENRTFLPLLL